jgi:hypothetical protein
LHNLPVDGPSGKLGDGAGRLVLTAITNLVVVPPGTLLEGSGTVNDVAAGTLLHGSGSVIDVEEDSPITIFVTALTIVGGRFDVVGRLAFTAITIEDNFEGGPGFFSFVAPLASTHVLNTIFPIRFDFTLRVSVPRLPYRSNFIL